MTEELFKSIIEEIDTVNKQDPNTVEVSEAESLPVSYYNSLLLTNWIQKLSDAEDKNLLIAARAKHIGRWKIPRSEYPEGRNGYLKWRTTLNVQHAAWTGEILEKYQLSAEDIEEIKSIILKKNLKKDDKVQMIEDALCLVFLETQLEEFSKKYEEDKLVDIIQKTWVKMSDQGHSEALKLIYSPRVLSVIQKALNA